jgi:hypothetical protein
MKLGSGNGASLIIVFGTEEETSDYVLCDDKGGFTHTLPFPCHAVLLRL